MAAPAAIGLPAILQALALAGRPMGQLGTNPFPALAGIPDQQNFLQSGGGDLNPILFGLLNQGLPARR